MCASLEQQYILFDSLAHLEQQHILFDNLADLDWHFIEVG